MRISTSSTFVPQVKSIFPVLPLRSRFSTSSGKKISLIVLEKPLADSLRQAKKIVALARKNKQAMLINHERRYALDYLHLKKQIQKKTYGNLLNIVARLYMGRDRTIHHILWEDGTHLLDILFFLTGDTTLSVVKSMASPSANPIANSRNRKESQLTVLARLNSIPITFDLGGARNHLAFEMDFSFETGFIRIGNGVYEEWQAKTSPYYEKMNSLVKINKRFNQTLYFSNMMAHAVDFTKRKLRMTLQSNDASHKNHRKLAIAFTQSRPEDAYASLKAVRTILRKSFLA